MCLGSCHRPDTWLQLPGEVDKFLLLKGESQ